MAFADAQGPYYGDFGGRFVAESLMGPIEELDAAWQRLWKDLEFQLKLRTLFRQYAGRPSLLTEAPRFAEDLGGVRVFLKREDLNHTGSHKINNVLGQALLTQELGKTRVIAETGAGQHGVATATAAALLGLECTIYMGEEDTQRQALNVARMQMLGAQVVAVTAGSRTLKDAINEAFRDWVTNVDTTNYIFGTAAGPHPFPGIVRDLQRVIGDEARAQLLEREGRLPDMVCACIGGGSNAIGTFTGFLDDPDVELIGCEAAGDGVDTGKHAASITANEVGVLHGARTFVLQERDGQTKASHSISAGLDYPGVGPEHAWLARQGRVTYVPITDADAMDAFLHLSRTEGIIPAIESAHALAGARQWAKRICAQKGPFAPGEEPICIVTVSGRGDKDVDTASRWFGFGAATRQVIDPSAGESAVAPVPETQLPKGGQQ
ncbi:tryptophan synthase subunit beta [Schaalia sp. ZJ405]|uniref:tryptophan synthase subunit beta n=1 Tax=Schaalia sp. ZJ405 TaxID=2709403 RepID=UPI0013EBA2F5|nr:tryptophan synthase subunit beta [Schaalia sp. ZJ405]QPK80501.1 tryptophan synthase subunit beta [Schaalia sp. ZJ405]